MIKLNAVRMMPITTYLLARFAVSLVDVFDFIIQLYNTLW